MLSVLVGAQVVSGMDVVNKIGKTKCVDDNPVTPVKMISTKVN